MWPQFQGGFIGVRGGRNTEWEGAYLVYNIQKLKENPGKAAGLVGDGLVAAMGEAVTEREPLFLHKDAKSFESSVVRVQQ